MIFLSEYVILVEVVGSGGKERKLEVKKFNLKKKLLKKNVIDEIFCHQLHRLSLEEIISLKLQLAAEEVRGKLFGFPLTKFVSNIVKEALITFALTSSSSFREAAKILGLSHVELYNYNKKHNILQQTTANKNKKSKCCNLTGPKETKELINKETF